MKTSRKTSIIEGTTLRIGERIIHLNKVDEKTISYYRKTNKRGVLVKYNDIFYFTSESMNKGSVDKHLCSRCRNFLQCKKVLDKKSIKRLENYSFIKNGYESFNASSDECDFFIVSGCQDYEKETHREFY